MTIAEFEAWIASTSVNRTITRIQEHHTWSPAYASFTGSNHFALQKGMRDYHVNTNGWMDIGQHFSIFPDGAVVTGRPLNNSPACIYGANSQAVCIENVGNFDAGHDAMNQIHATAIVRATAALARRFNLLPVTSVNVVYHHWFDLNTGQRTNGSGTTKSCPGTAFFGGNKVADCEANFLPLVRAALGGSSAAARPARTPAALRGYGRVTAEKLVVRNGPGPLRPRAKDQAPLQSGSVVRIFDEKDNWLKVANGKEHWVAARHVKGVARKTVNANNSKMRAGPATTLPILASMMKGDEVFVDEEKDGWARAGEAWISKSLLA